MRNVIVTAGPIPASLDSVKYITNRFKGRMGAATARFLSQVGHNVTMVCFKYSEIARESHPGVNIVTVDDVKDYCSTVASLAQRADAVVLAAAVANLMPSEPWTGKFPSHQYEVGSTFNVQFEIAPRVIDLIKKVNPRCCLIAYKLLDGDHNELIEAARKIIRESGANAVFANSPDDLKNKSLVLPEGGVIPMTYRVHNKWIDRMINLRYNVSVKAQGRLPEINWAEAIVEHFEKYIRAGDDHGSCAVAFDGGWAMTSRNHEGVSFVTGMNEVVNSRYNKEIHHFGPKPTKNAVLMALETSDERPIVHHRHHVAVAPFTASYQFPGTDEEIPHGCDYNTAYHGSVARHELNEVDWNEYYKMFPSRYFGFHPKIEEIYHLPIPDHETLDVGCNTKVRAKWGLDPYVEQNEDYIRYDDLPGRRFEAIAINNSINYLSDQEIAELMASLKIGGRLVANTFRAAPWHRVTENEIVTSDQFYVNHVLWHGGKYYHHVFRNVTASHWRGLGFEVTEYNDRKSLLLEYTREK